MKPHSLRKTVASFGCAPQTKSCAGAAAGQLTSVSVHFAVVVLDELLDEGAVLVQDLVSHVGDVVEDRLVFHLRGTTTRHTLIRGRV